MIKISSFICGLLALPLFLAAQPVGNIRGVVTDGASGQALPYVSVVVLNSNPVVGTTTDEAGNFRLNNLPVGRYDIQSSFVGYEPAVFREIMVGSGREIFLEITMRENIQELEEVTIRAKVNKEAPLNPMALAGARMLSVEEASRYAGGLDDPARLVTARRLWFRRQQRRCPPQFQHGKSFVLCVHQSCPKLRPRTYLV